ncbi:MAG TPA: DNA-formamidopyrimidine glycosylase family protein [Pyrinomonadaceae bacterium]|jgi:formamidopyrimidine-DNA glycosylase|nr:DNA-formamidopyrimidine glycosylase family protein [Pyrinomonadaceae bacterium]
MPEYPDIVVYIEALEKRIQGHRLERVLIASPFLLRTAVPPLSSVEGRQVVELRRLGKRICVGLENNHWLVLHLMIAGRLHWKENAGTGKRSKRHLAAFEFDSGRLTLTEAGTQRRASLHVVEGEEGLSDLDPGGLEVFELPDARAFAAVLQSTNHTLKRALTDPRLFSGIGNAYSDEILFEARLSPVKLTQKLTSDELEQLYTATRATLNLWVARLREETGAGFPEGVTAFRKDMSVHGRYKQPCLRCGAKIQRIRYASNETNYCPVCQTGGKLLADRALSRLLRSDWPKSAEE